MGQYQRHLQVLGFLPSGLGPLPSACVLRWLVASVAVAVLQAGSIGAQPADPPAQPALSAEQQERLAERDHWGRETVKLRQQGKLAEAIAAAEKMLAIEREVLGNDNEDVAGSLIQLAEMHEEQEDFGAARECREEVLEIKTRLYGQEHWQATDARLALEHTQRVNGLPVEDRRELREADALDVKSVALYRAGKFKDAATVAEQALAIRKKVLGEEHRDCATSLNDLAYLYVAQGEYARAEPLYQQTLAIERKVLGEEHPDYAITLNNLAALYYEQGDYARAEPLYQQVLAIRKKVLGEQHPSYAGSLNNLAYLYYSQGKYARAEPLYHQALAIVKKLLGEEHANYAASLNNLALLYKAQGDYARAEPLLQQALSIRKKVLGEGHPEYATSLNNLALLFRLSKLSTLINPQGRKELSFFVMVEASLLVAL